MAAVSPVRPAPTMIRSGFTRRAPLRGVLLAGKWRGISGRFRLIFLAWTPWKVPASLPGVDPENVAAAQQGDALALDRLLDELAPYVRRLCARIAPAAADDATQEALLAVFRGLPSLRAPEAIMTWVRSVTVRTAIRLARQHDLEVAAEGMLLDRCASSLEGLVDIDDALARLPVSQRVVLVLRTREGLSEQEIAITLGIPAGTVKSRLHRARAAFREVWES